MKARSLFLIIFFVCSLSSVSSQTDEHTYTNLEDSIPIIEQALANKYTKNEEGYFVFGDTIECTLSKEELFTNAKLWLVNFASFLKVEVKYEDLQAGIIMLKTKIKDERGTSYTKKVRVIYFNMTIRVKDKKYMYYIEPLKDKVQWFEKDIGGSIWYPYQYLNNNPDMIKGYNYLPEIIQHNLYKYESSHNIVYLERAISQFKEYDFLYITFQIIAESFKLSMITNNDF